MLPSRIGDARLNEMDAHLAMHEDDFSLLRPGELHALVEEEIYRRKAVRAIEAGLSLDTTPEQRARIWETGQQWIDLEQLNSRYDTASEDYPDCQMRFDQALAQIVSGEEITPWLYPDAIQNLIYELNTVLAALAETKHRA